MKEVQLTRNGPENLIVSSEISPDGKLVAYVDQKGLILARTDSGETHQVPLPGDTSIAECSLLVPRWTTIDDSDQDGRGRFLPLDHFNLWWQT